MSLPGWIDWGYAAHTAEALLLLLHVKFDYLFGSFPNDIPLLVHSWDAGLPAVVETASSSSGMSALPTLFASSGGMMRPLTQCVMVCVGGGVAVVVVDWARECTAAPGKATPS